MSFEEIHSLLKAENERIKRQFEISRLQWFYTLIAPGLSKATKPSDIITFEWEKEEKPKRQYNKDRVERNSKQLQKWLNNRLT